MEGMINRSSSSPLQDGHSHSHSQIQSYDAPPAAATHDDFLEQMLSTIPNCSSWPDLSNNPNNNNNNNKSPTSDDQQTLPPNSGNPDAVHFPFDDSVLASKLRQHQMNENSSAAAVKSFLLQEQLMMSRGGGLRSPSGGDGTAGGGGDGGEAGGLLPHLNPLSLGGVGSGDSVDSRILLARSHGEVAAVQGGHGSVQALFNGFGGGGSLHGNNGQNPNQQPQFHHSPQNFGSPGGAAAAAAMNQTPGSASSGGGSGQAPQRQRVRARRGQATDPHSIAERLRRERIAERMKALQELVPNANKTDKASMLDEIIDYVKFLQLQVKVLSMSRLGGAAAVNPVVADMSAEGGGVSRTANGNQTAPSTNNNDSTLTVTEHQVAKLMKEDMGSAMQYLQGKGLCLMPISLATAISTATCHPRNSSSLSSSSAAAAAVAAAAAISGGVGNPLSNGIMNGASASNFNHQNGSNNALIVAASNGEGTPTSPNLSVLTVQSGGVAVAADGSVKDATSQ